MSRVVDLNPSPHREPVQCETPIEEMQLTYMAKNNPYRLKKAASRGHDPDRCGKTARYRIDGRNLCAFHAGIVAIAILSRDTTIDGI